MGQRSQMYVRINTEDGKKYLVARYFQWNYGERMVSRARYTLEWLESQYYPYTLYHANCGEKLKLPHIMETNFDYKDVVLSTDIIEEYKEYADGDLNFIFSGQDNNDGQFMIDMIVDWEKKNRNGYHPVKFKYAFVFPYDYVPMDGDEYMQKDFRDDPDDVDYELWRESKYFKKSVKYTERNIRYLQNHAELMTADEMQEFIKYPYDIDMELDELPF